MFAETKKKILALLCSQSLVRSFNFEVVEPSQNQILITIELPAEERLTHKVCVLVSGSETSTWVVVSLALHGGHMTPMDIGQARSFRKLWDVTTDLASLIGFSSNGAL